MDERQTQIKEGAGLEENRINQEFLDFLNKWSGPVLILFAVIMLALWGNRVLGERRAAHLDEAYMTLNNAMAGGNPSPDSLRQIADDYDDVPGMADMARIAAATIYLQSATLGVRPGAELGPTGGLANPEDALDAQQVTEYLQTADSLYQRVLADAEPAGRILLALNAAWGRAAVAASLGRVDEARGLYERVAALADSGGFEIQARLARSKAQGVGDLTEPPHLYTPDELPAVARDEADPALDAVETIINLSGDAPLITRSGEEPVASEPDAGDAPVEGDDEAVEPTDDAATDDPAEDPAASDPPQNDPAEPDAAP